MVRTRSNFFSGMMKMVIVGGAAAVLMSFAPRFISNTPLVSADSVSAPAAATEQYSTFTNNRYQYSVSYPTGWRMGEGSVKSNVTTITSYVAPVGHGTGSNQATSNNRASLAKIDVVVYPIAEGTSVSDFVQQRTDAPLEGEMVPTQLAGAPALRVTTPIDGSSYNYVTIFATHGNYGYILSGMAAADVFDHMVNSFSLRQ